MHFTDEPPAVRRGYEEERDRYERGRQRRFESFGVWLQRKVQSRREAGEAVDINLATMTKLPSSEVEHYMSMWAYGFHYRVDEEIGPNHVTNDSGVAAIITQECRSSLADRRPVEADLLYVGIIKEILQVEYGHILWTTMKCSWIRPQLEGIRTIKRDEHGFWLVKFNARQIPAVEPYILPVHAKQVGSSITQFPFCHFF